MDRTELLSAYLNQQVKVSELLTEIAQQNPYTPGMFGDYVAHTWQRYGRESAKDWVLLTINGTKGFFAVLFINGTIASVTLTEFDSSVCGLSLTTEQGFPPNLEENLKSWTESFVD